MKIWWNPNFDLWMLYPINAVWIVSYAMMQMQGGILGQNLGYDRCPYLSFFNLRDEDEYLRFDRCKET